MSDFIRNTKIKEIRGYLLIIWAISFPFWIKLSSILLGLSTVFYLLDSIINKKFVFRIKEYLPILIFFLLVFLSLLYTEDISRGLSDVKKKLPLVLIPFAFWGVDSSLAIKIKNVFVYAILTYCLLYFVVITFLYSQYAEESFRNIFESQVRYYLIKWHPTYLALYIIMALSFVLHELRYKFSFIRLVFAIILISHVLLLSSRSAIFCSVFMFFVYIINIIIHNKKWIIFSCTLLFVIPSIVYFTSSNKLEVIKEKIINDVRLSTVWPIVFKITQKNSVIGIGSGDVRANITKEIIAEKKESLLLYGELNTHNVFLEVLASIGILGLIVFIGIILLPFFLLEKKSLYVFFLFIFITLSFFESTLNRQAGVIFFGFFYFFILWQDYKIENHLILRDLSKYDRIYLIMNISTLFTIILGGYFWNFLPMSKTKHQEIKLTLVSQTDFDDKFKLYYIGDEYLKFTNDLMSNIKISGGNDFKKYESTFFIKDLRRIRFDLGVNHKEQKQVLIKSVSLQLDGNTFPLPLDLFVGNFWCTPKIKNKILSCNLRVCHNNYAPSLVSSDLSVFIRAKTGYYYWFSAYFILFYLLSYTVISFVFFKCKEVK